jgi:hypothetical protein
VDQEVVRQPGQPLDRLLIINSDGFFAKIAARHDQGAEAAIGKQKMV